MNEWDRLHRQAERYKAEYPPGTRIMLLSMGEDMHRVEDNTRGTVITVDDIGTLHDLLVRQVLEFIVVESKDRIKVIFAGGLKVEQNSF